MPIFLWIDGDQQQCFGEFDAAPAWALREVPRMPGHFERWDEEMGSFQYDAAGHANAEAGAAHIAAMHARKAVEAHLIAAGVAAPGMLLVREAALRGISAAELAEAVLSKIAPIEALELNRQAASLPGNGVDHG